MKHARKADSELKKFQATLDHRLCPVAELATACADLKASVQGTVEMAKANTATCKSNFTGIASLMTLMTTMLTNRYSQNTRITALDDSIATIARAQADLPQLVTATTLTAVDTLLASHMLQI